MDNFMDKLVEKINMQNSRASRNSSGDEELYKNTRTEIENFKNTTHEDLENLKKEIQSQKEDARETAGLINDGTDKVLNEIRQQKIPTAEEMSSAFSDIVHKEDVKLYRNVQAVVADENKKTIEELQKLDRSEEFKKVGERLEDIESVEGVVAGRTSGLKSLIVAAIVLLSLNLCGIIAVLAKLFGII